MDNLGHSGPVFFLLILHSFIIKVYDLSLNKSAHFVAILEVFVGQRTEKLECACVISVLIYLYVYNTYRQFRRHMRTRFFSFLCRTNTSKIATKCGLLFHVKSCNIDFERVWYQRKIFKNPQN